MPRYRVHGIDHDSGYETSIVVEAATENDAKVKARNQGLDPHAVVIENRDERPNSARSSKKSELWRAAEKKARERAEERRQMWVIAQGVCSGIWLFVITFVILTTCLGVIFLQGIIEDVDRALNR